MKCHFVDDLTSSKRIGEFHYIMYHGEAERKGYRGLDPGHSIGDDLSEPLEIRRNGKIVPEIFRPTLSLIVSEKVKQKLEHFPNIVFLKVVFKKLVDYDFQVGDFSYYRRPAYKKNPRKEDPQKLLQRLQDEPALHQRMGTDYELVIPKLKDLEKEFELRNYQVRVKKPGELAEKIDVPLSKNLLEKYPIFYYEGLTCFSDEYYKIVEPYFDWEFFIHFQIELT